MQSLAKQEKEILLRLARSSIERKVSKNSIEITSVQEEILHRPSGAFVTLHLWEQLRGCIGRIRSSDPLYRVVQEMAMAAATQDPRFPPLQIQEISEIHIEISVLSVPQVLTELREIEVGRHGLIISAAGRSGLLLPQVASEEGWDVETFLSHTCMKAGLPMDFWTYGNPKIEIFSAEVFSERELETSPGK
jgi:AmmeMemoRadiSam system protein A